MAENEKDKQLDKLLDSVLSQYSSEEPRPGLETRVLARIAESRHGSKVNVWHWLYVGAGAAAVAAVIIALLVATQSRRLRIAPTIVQNQPQSSSREATLMNREITRVPQPRIRHGKRLIRPARVAEVRKEVFPSPEPLSEQERLMLRYLSETPHQELAAQSHPDPPPDARALKAEFSVYSSTSNDNF